MTWTVISEKFQPHPLAALLPRPEAIGTEVTFEPRLEWEYEPQPWPSLRDVQWELVQAQFDAARWADEDAAARRARLADRQWGAKTFGAFMKDFKPWEPNRIMGIDLAKPGSDETVMLISTPRRAGRNWVAQRWLTGDWGEDHYDSVRNRAMRDYVRVVAEGYAASTHAYGEAVEKFKTARVHDEWVSRYMVVPTPEPPPAPRPQRTLRARILRKVLRWPGVRTRAEENQPENEV